MELEPVDFTVYIASTIHDMKNSLNIQVSSLESIAQECRARGDADTFKKLTLLIYEANRMNANLIQLLSLYKIGQSSYPMDVAEHCVADVLEEALLQNRTLMEFKGLQVHVECDAQWHWYFDRDLVTGILVNALNNAYRYTDTKICIAATVADGVLELRVEDDGRGYPPSMLQDGAVLANKGVNFFSGSTGLGFHFTALAAAMHKNGSRCGTLHIENGGRYGGGCFVVRLP